jgi:predicted Zn-dependent protease
MTRLKIALSLLLFLLSSAALTRCTTAPVTGRSQFILPTIDAESEIRMGIQAYTEVVKKGPISKDPKLLELVSGVGKRIAAVVEDPVKSRQIGLADPPHYPWEFTVIDDPKTVNAFALPGGKVVVYTGILPYTKNEAGLATVLGHEIGHAIARHGVERMSRGKIAELGATGLDILLGGSGNDQERGLIHQAFGIGTNVGVMLPFERSQESEADHIGLNLMAMAGYNPEEAIPFWQRMSAENKNHSPEFLSTHPADQRRIDQIRIWLPDALTHYRP